MFYTRAACRCAQAQAADPMKITRQLLLLCRLRKPVEVLHYQGFRQCALAEIDARALNSDLLELAEHAPDAPWGQVRCSRKHKDRAPERPQSSEENTSEIQS